MINKTMKVIKILNSTRVIINAGSRDGIKEDQLFEIYRPGEDVYDPETNELLGSADLIKARIVPVDIQEKMTICTGYGDIPFIKVLASFGNNKEINVNPNAMSAGYSKKDERVDVGDLVRYAANLKNVSDKAIALEAANIDNIEIEE